MLLYDICPDGMILRSYVQTGAKNPESIRFISDRLKIKIGCPAVDGKANKEL